MDGGSLADLEDGSRGVIEQILGGREVNKRLLSLGVAPGIEFTMDNNYHLGPIIIQINDTKVAIGRGEAGKILVKPIDGESKK
jgi:ferrous iron transport protein A